MDSLSNLILPLEEYTESAVRLVGARFRLANSKECCEFTMSDGRVLSLSYTPLSPNKFIANPSGEMLTPLLISVPSNLSHLDITVQTQRVLKPFDLLLLVKRLVEKEDTCNVHTQGLSPHNTTISRFSISSTSDTSRKYTLTTHLPASTLTSGVLTVSAQGPSEHASPLFSFSVWIDEMCLPEPTLFNAQDPLTDELPPTAVFPDMEPISDHPLDPLLTAATDDIPATNYYKQNSRLATSTQDTFSNLDTTTTLLNFAREFRFNITDGPSFRNELNMLESKAPQFLNYSKALLETLLALQTYLRRLVREKSRLVLCVRRMIELRLGSLVSDKNFYKKFESHIDDIILPFKRQMDHFIHHVCDPNLVYKISGNYMLVPLETTGSTVSSSGRLTNNPTLSTSSKGGVQPVQAQDPSAQIAGSAVVEIIRARKQCDAACKSFYSWTSRYLANDKERPLEKLLAKRKVFELAKFDYLNTLDLVTNNQYTNHLLESLFEFVQSSKPYSHATSQTVDIVSPRSAAGEDSLQDLLDPSHQVLFNILMQYNSGKYQFRQMIQAAQTNEKLSEILLQGQARLSFAHCISPQGITPHPLDFDRFLLGSAKFDHKIVGTLDESCKSGILHVLGGKGKQGWHKEWVVLRDGQLAEFSDWREGKVLVLTPIEVALASIKPVTFEKRQHCFEVFTSQGQRRVFQALLEDERTAWLAALYRAGQHVDHTRLQSASLNAPKKPDRVLRISTGLEKHTVLHFQEILLPLNNQPPRVFNNIETDCFEIVRGVPNSENLTCVDCGLLEGVEWLALNHLVCFCVSCASCHRNLGSHVSIVRSLRLDVFEDETKLLLQYVSNARANAILEPHLKNAKPNSGSSHEERMAYIREKYQVKRTLSEEMQTKVNGELVTNIQQLNVPAIMESIFRGASLNTRITITAPKHERKVIVSAFEYLLRKYVEADETGQRHKYFVASELMIINGCDVSRSLADISLLNMSSDAKSYWQKRRIKLGHNSPEKLETKKAGPLP